MVEESKLTTDKQKENTSLPVASAGQEPASALKEKQKHRTVGNVIYDWGIYGSVAWAGVATLSLLSAHEAMHGHNKNFGWLRALDKNASGGLKNLLSTTILKGRPEREIEGWARGTTMFLTLGMGGNALMLPLKWLEDNREHNAAKIDNFLGTTPPDPATIAAEVPQTWKSVFSGRLFSWGMSYAAFVAMGPGIASKASNWCGEKYTNAFMKLRPSANPVKVRKWADIGAFDALFTVITASLTYAFSRHVAKHDQEKHKADDVAPLLNPVFVDHVPEELERNNLLVKTTRPKPTASPSYTKRIAAEVESQSSAQAI